jgi:putative DNA primase/helicase
MDFISFCRGHGIIIDQTPPIGVWKRYRTEDHPNKKNGAVKWMGTYGFVQNHALDTAVSVWQSDKPDDHKFKQFIQAATDKVEFMQEKAARKAGWILNQCELFTHEYCVRKGFPDEKGNVWFKDDHKILVIPMRVGNRLVGCQMISETGEKKFLFGQRTSGASFVFDNHGPNFYCEGYATALSLRMILKSMKRRYTIHVTFSAHNLAKLAKDGYVIADNDASGTGEEVAKRTRLPYFMPPEVGDDFNDYHRKVGILKAGLALTKSLKL